MWNYKRKFCIYPLQKKLLRSAAPGMWNYKRECCIWPLQKKLSRSAKPGIWNYKREFCIWPLSGNLRDLVVLGFNSLLHGCVIDSA